MGVRISFASLANFLYVVFSIVVLIVQTSVREL